MPIPTRFDYQLAEVENAAASVLLVLRRMQHCADKDIPVLRADLRDRLQALVDLAMDTARVPA